MQLPSYWACAAGLHGNTEALAHIQTHVDYSEAIGAVLVEREGELPVVFIARDETPPPNGFWWEA